jgi:PIN domain nuclease of toxin-antitoxin system
VPRNLVVDTHTLLFALTAPDRLGAAARRLLRDAEAGHAIAWIPAAVITEMVMLRELGRVAVGLPEIQITLERTSSLRFLAIDLDQIDEFAALTAIREPFDRLIVGAARALDAVLITRDRTLAESGLVRVVWA